MLDRISPLSGFDQTFHGLRLWERDDLALVSIAIPLSKEVAAERALKSAFNLALPEPGHSAASDTHRLIRMGPDQMMVIFADESALAEPSIAAALKGTCYTTNQTDAWVALAIEGPHVRSVLERLCPLDLHPEAFAVDAAARTVMEHMGVVIIREDQDRFLLLSASSSARSFLHAVETSINYTH